MRKATLLVAFALLSACGGGGGGPTTPPPAQPTAFGLDFTIAPALNGATEVEFRWSGSDAASYRLEIGTSSGASDAATLDAGSATTFTWARVPIGAFYARVKGLQGATVGAPSNEVVVGSIDARRMIDALVFGYGPLAVAGNAGRSLNSGIWQDRVLGWQPGSGFGVILGESVPATHVAAAEKTVQQIGPATRGAVTAGIAGRRPDPLQSPAPGEVTLSLVGDEAALKTECRCEQCVGCARTFYLGSFAQRAQILLGPSAAASTVAHELGHVIGLAHAISAAGVRPPFTMGVTTDGQFSPSGRLDTLDRATTRMLETIYAAGFTAGTHRRQFEAAGFVLPEGASAVPAASERGSNARIEKQVGLETVVLKPFCQ